MNRFYSALTLTLKITGRRVRESEVFIFRGSMVRERNLRIMVSLIETVKDSRLRENDTIVRNYS